MWATPRRLSVVTVEEGWWFPEPSQSFSPWALALCSWPCKGPWQLTLPHVSGEGGFGIVNLSNVELHWTSLQKLVCLVNGRKNFHQTTEQIRNLKEATSSARAWASIFATESSTVSLASVSAFLISLIWLLAAVTLLSLLFHLTALHDFTVRLTCFVKMLHRCVAPEKKQNSFCK